MCPQGNISAVCIVTVTADDVEPTVALTSSAATRTTKVALPATDRASVGKVRPVGLLWAVWGVLVLAAYGRPVWTSTRLMVDPVPAGGTVDAHLRAQATVTGSWVAICCALLAVGLVGFSQLERASLGLRRTARTPLVLGRGVGAGLAYLFILSAAAAMTANALSSLHVVERVYPVPSRPRTVPS